jgi:hypothetical protein
LRVAGITSSAMQQLLPCMLYSCRGDLNALPASLQASNTMLLMASLITSWLYQPYILYCRSPEHQPVPVLQLPGPGSVHASRPRCGVQQASSAQPALLPGTQR